MHIRQGGGGIKQNRDLRLANLAVQKCTRTYIVERCGSKIFLTKNGRDINKVLLPVLTASVSPRMAIVLCRSDVFCVSKKTRVHILTRRSKYEQGGSWNNNADNAARAYRDNNNPDNRNNNLGFRVAMSKN